MRVVLVSADDWEGIYLDDFLVDESHRFNARDVIEILGDKVISDVQFYWINQTYMEDLGSLPDKFKDIEEKYLEKEDL